LKPSETSKFGGSIPTNHQIINVAFSTFPRNTYALILGASSGFGGAAAVELARHGVNIIGVHLDRAATMPLAEAVQKQIADHGAEAHFFNVNAVDADQRADVLDQVEALFAERDGATVRVLMHSLAFGALRPLVAPNAGDELRQAQIEMTMNVMANSLVYWTQDLLHRRLMKHGGRIFAMTSAGSHRVLPMYGAVSAAKAALESYCRQLAFELGEQGIGVNAIQAGVTDTPALRKIPGTEQIIASALERNPHRRLTTPEDVARIVALLSSDEAAWINGSVLTVDGGEDAVDINWMKSPEAS
jgi:NAD(P)-dependent dehydrogenase (short-subunit alcohol dehydrogenase family)